MCNSRVYVRNWKVVKKHKFCTSVGEFEVSWGTPAHICHEHLDEWNDSVDLFVLVNEKVLTYFNRSFVLMNSGILFDKNVSLVSKMFLQSFNENEYRKIERFWLFERW